MGPDVADAVRPVCGVGLPLPDILCALQRGSDQ